MSVSTATLLVELRCEEMPPQLAPQLAEKFSAGLAAKLTSAGYRPAHAACHEFSTPRRLAALLSGVQRTAAASCQKRRGPAVARAYDEAGVPTKALAGFLASNDSQEGDLSQQDDENGVAYVYVDRNILARKLADEFGAILEQVLRSMVAPRQMRWGHGDWQFVRPVRGVCAVHGKRAVKATVFGLPVTNKTKGHRFLAPAEFRLAEADGYVAELKERRVVVSRKERVATILRELPKGTDTIEKKGSLPDELAGMCEWPVPYEASFDQMFIDRLPAAVVRTCINKHLRSFTVRDPQNDSQLPRFCFVADNEFAKPASLQRGLERVMHARLTDTLFMYEHDTALDTEELLRRLKGITYVKGMGSLYERGKRLARLAEFSVAHIWESNGHEGLDRSEWRRHLTRAAELCQVDHGTLMFAEYPELTGILAADYLSKFEEDGNISMLVGDKVSPEHGQLGSPASAVKHSLRLADHMERLVTFAAFDQLPTGAGDVAGLRKSAYEVVAILGCYPGLQLGLFLSEAIELVYKALKDGGTDPKVLAARERCSDNERMASKLRKLLLGYEGIIRRQRKFYKQLPPPDTRILHAVLSSCDDPDIDYYDLGRRIAVLDYFAREKADDYTRLLTLAKRLENINRKGGKKEYTTQKVKDAGNSDYLAAESDLEEKVKELREEQGKTVHKCVSDILYEDGHRLYPNRDFYFHFLCNLVRCEPIIERFFREVTVNSDVAEERTRRLALVSELHDAFNYVADMRRLYS